MDIKTIELVKLLCDKSDIVSVIGKYIKLKKKGNDYVGVCPFHPDKNPSLSVSPKRKIWKCFVCGVGGNVLRFIEKFFKCSQKEAIKRLSEDIGFNLESYESLFVGSDIDPKIKYLYDINKFLSKLYEQFLFDKKNEDKIAYLYKRGLDDETIKYFKLGYAPNDLNLIRMILCNENDMFQNYDKNNVWTDLQLLESGVINENRMVYFTNRIIFPIFNIEDKIVGFSGRTLTNEEPRYLNSKENGIFFKSKFLFNLNNVVKLSDVTNLYILEGYMDVIALHRAGVLNAVATMGVNLSSSHIETILAIENIKTVTLCFDNDEAGKLATFTNGISLLKSNIEVLVVNKNDEYKDMDALLKEKGKERLLSDLHNTSDFISYIIAIKLKESKLLTDVKEIFSIMIETNDILLKTKHLELICKMTGLHIDDVKTYYEQEKKKIVGDFSNKPHQEQFEVKEIKKNKNEEEKKINLFEINCRKILADFLFNAINKPQIIENFFSKIGFSIPQKYYPEFYNIFKILLLFVKEHDNEKQNYENFLNFVKEKCGMDVENEVKMFNDTNIRGSFETNYVEAGMKNIEQLKKKLLEYEIHLRLEKIKTEKDDKKIIGYWKEIGKIKEQYDK